MAEKRESNKGELYKCSGCGRLEIIFPNNPRKDGRSCKDCGGHMSFYGFAGIDYSNCKSLIGINVDCSEALTGLKAVTREAKKATAALKELEDQQEKMSRQPIRYKETR
jgi:DNA-directed RNA polymerase subunit RPC12/RpoP